MLETMTKLQTVYLSSGSQGTISFTNIPQTYTDLCVKVSVRSTYASTYYDNMLLTFNGSSSGYSFARGIGIGNGISTDGPFATQGNIYIGEVPAVTATTSTFSNNEIYLPNYSGNTPKQVNVDKTLENTSTTYILGMVVGLWNNTSPINSINLSLASGSFAQFSEVTLYGVKAMRTAVGNSIKATGGAISFDGTYVYHTFNSTDTFTATSKIIADIAVAAGGGGGGGSTSGAVAGGGGGGGLAYAPSVSLTPSTPYTITIGAGGTAGASGNNVGTAGSNTGALFGSVNITTFGGGYGSGGYSTGTSVAGGAGGSGGGAGWGTNYGSLPGGATTQTSGTGYTGYGYAGGAVTIAGGNGAGGGGASGAGGGNSTPGYGGSGLAEFGITLSAGGAGYSGVVVNGTVSSPGSPNTGNGGNGGWSSAGANGGSGVVIVRYKA